MYRRLVSHSLVGVGLALGLGACSAPDVSQPCPVPPDANDAQRTAALNQCFKAMTADVVDTRLKKDVDILFIVDNSTSMSPKQAQLGKVIPKFIAGIDGTNANYHVGVVTSDIGTLPPPGNPFPGSSDTRCNTFKGDDGLLQNVPCTGRTQNVSSEFNTACRGGGTVTALCPDPTFVPTDRWISKQDGITNTPVKMGPDPNNPGKMIDIGPLNAFQCIGLVGDGGCGVESQLEAAKRALDGHLTENTGFLRDDSVLAVIWITDEDDCSVQIGQRMNLNPSSMNCGTANSDPAYSCYNLDYRCIAKDLLCNEPLDTPGPKTGCKERTNSFLQPVDTYVRFFSALRPANKLVLGGIWSPSLTDYYNRNNMGDGQLNIDSEAGTDYSTNVLNRGQKTKAACYNTDPTLTTDPKGYFGQAQVRLEAFKNRFDPSIWSEQSICDAANYTKILDNIKNSIQGKLGIDCLGVTPNKDSSGNPICLVGFVDANQEGALPDSYLPQCSSTCCAGWASSTQPYGPYGTNGMTDKDPKIKTACGGESADCYCATPSTAGLCSSTVLAGVWRVGNADTPPGKVVSFRCAGTRPPAAPTM